jgi:hypothetical protein
LVSPSEKGGNASASMTADECSYLTNEEGLERSLIVALTTAKSDGSPDKNAYYREKTQSLKRDRLDNQVHSQQQQK